jgi:hypothetical protein
MLCVVFFSCKKEQDLSTIDLGYDFFPSKVGSYVIYEVDSTSYGVTTETFHYQIKEELSEEFEDDLGEPAFMVKRYLRHNNSQPWILADVWSQKRVSNRAEKVEENIRYVKLKFPTKDGDSWNGNAYNNLPEQSYKYKNVGKPADVGILQFPNTLTVEQLNNVNLVDNQVFYEIYAHNVGLVFKQATNLNVQASQTSGYDLQYRAVAHGGD